MPETRTVRIDYRKKPPDQKDPRFVESGRRAARKRWIGHDPATVRLDDLTAPQRRLVLALIAAAKSENEKRPETETAA